MTIDKNTARTILCAIASNNTETLSDLGIRVYGNKGKRWTNTACITNLDDIKGKCNPRLAFNSCELEHIGCTNCIATLKELAK